MSISDAEPHLRISWIQLQGPTIHLDGLVVLLLQEILVAVLNVPVDLHRPRCLCHLNATVVRGDEHLSLHLMGHPLQQGDSFNSDEFASIGLSFFKDDSSFMHPNDAQLLVLINADDRSSTLSFFSGDVVLYQTFFLVNSFYFVLDAPL